MKKLLLTLLALSVATASCWAISRQSLVSYASSLQGLKGAELKAALHTLMQPSTILDYGSGSGSTWSGFYKTDRNAETNECYNRYSSKTFYFSSTTSSISGMNIEHSFPKSWWGGAKNNAYKDLYNLYPSDSDANSSKSNYAMGVVTTVKTSEEGYDKVGTGTINGVSGTSCWEPGDQYKGDFSRSYLYMGVVYSNLTFQGTGLQTMSNEDYPGMKAWATTLYTAWGKADRVSTLERDRNNAVAKIQGNRNLFVDFPYLADYVWGDSASVAFNPATSLSTADDDSRYMDTQPVDPETPEEGDDVKFQKVTSFPGEGEYLIVASVDGALKAANPVTSTKGYGYLYTTNVTDKEGIITLTADEISYTLKATTGGYYLIDHQGRYYYQSGTYNSYRYTTDVSQAGIWTVSAQTDGTFRIATGNYYMQYSTQYSSYGCYNSSQGILPLLYKKLDGTENVEALPADTPSTKSATVYTLQGQPVGTSLDKIPRGLYIQAGRKFVVK